MLNFLKIKYVAQQPLGNLDHCLLTHVAQQPLGNLDHCLLTHSGIEG
mgnify:CR=1 FL=1